MLATGNDISSADAGNLDPLLPTCSHFARTMPTSTPQDLFDAVRKVWSQSIHHDPDHPSLPCSLYAPILAAVLAIAAPSYSRTASELIIELYDHTLERLEPYPEQKSASGEDEPRYPRALRTPGDLRDQVLALGGKQRARLVLALRIREALVKSWPRESRLSFLIPLRLPEMEEKPRPSMCGGEMLTMMPCLALPLQSGRVSTSYRPARSSFYAHRFPEARHPASASSYREPLPHQHAHDSHESRCAKPSPEPDGSAAPRHSGHCPV